MTEKKLENRKEVKKLSFGENLRNARLKTALTQTDVAEILKVAQPTYAQYETSARLPNVLVAVKVARLFNTTCEELAGENPESKASPKA